MNSEKTAHDMTFSTATRQRRVTSPRSRYILTICMQAWNPGFPNLPSGALDVTAVESSDNYLCASTTVDDGSLETMGTRMHKSPPDLVDNSSVHSRCDYFIQLRITF